jgi:hypothetical protein
MPVRWFSMFAIAAALWQQSQASPSVLTSSSLSPGAPRLAVGTLIADTALDPSGGPLATSANYTLKPGFIGQLYDVVDLDATAQPSVINEGGTSQLSAIATMDDETTSLLTADSVAWSVVSGPLTSISTAGLATGGTVVGNRSASARGEAFGFTANASLTVQDSNRDNYQSVAGDGIDDVWQFAFFDADENGVLDGNEAAKAAPGANPDHDLYNNFFEWASGHDPKDPASFLRFQIISKIGATAQFRISSTLTGTTYAISKSATLAPAIPSFDVAGLTATTNDTDVELTDIGAISPSSFYRLRLEREP